MVIGRPLRIRALGRPFVSVGVAEGTVLVGNGGSIQAIPFGNSSGQSP
jgi:class 3 adenylate cyclase